MNEFDPNTPTERIDAFEYDMSTVPADSPHSSKDMQSAEQLLYLHDGDVQITDLDQRRQHEKIYPKPKRIWRAVRISLAPAIALLTIAGLALATALGFIPITVDALTSPVHALACAVLGEPSSCTPNIEEPSQAGQQPTVGPNDSQTLPQPQDVLPRLHHTGMEDHQRIQDIHTALSNVHN